jgi:hypothetical protein
MNRFPLKRAYLQMRNSIRFTFKHHGIFKGLGMCKTVLNRACNPWLRLPPGVDYTFQRYRPSTFPVNATLALGAIGWNIVRLPQTLHAGSRDRQRIRRCQTDRKDRPCAASQAS